MEGKILGERKYLQVTRHNDAVSQCHCLCPSPSIVHIVCISRWPFIILSHRGLLFMFSFCFSLSASLCVYCKSDELSIHLALSLRYNKRACVYMDCAWTNEGVCMPFVLMRVVLVTRMG